ncbi:MAG: hypothetical protein FWG68_11715 [Defluviitaleaceae bacterium]|nr:hypothetical protein [Defluviitaleaceae bacterium]
MGINGRPTRHCRGDRPRSPVMKPPTPTAAPPVGWGQTVARPSWFTLFQ